MKTIYVVLIALGTGIVGAVGGFVVGGVVGVVGGGTGGLIGGATYGACTTIEVARQQAGLDDAQAESIAEGTRQQFEAQLNEWGGNDGTSGPLELTVWSPGVACSEILQNQPGASQPDSGQ